jgi:Asp-tRNA(Asn)/Glu-tRNA(Gln) amidotransferase A subunit family amidase
MAQGPAVTRLVEAGALILGKTVTAEFAGADPGATTNPHDATRTPGGSSSGSAAAVASGYVPLALGTQTVGSTMRPAAFCGVVGFKPSFGRVSTAGMLPFSPSVDHVGWFTQDVAGSRLVAGVLAEGWDDVAPPSRSLVLGVPVGPYLAQAEPAAIAAFEATLAGLIARDVVVRRVPMFDDIATVAEHHRAISLAEFSDVHADRFRRLGSLFRPISAMRFDVGQTVTPAARAAGAASRVALRERLQSAMDAHEIDAWACPSTLGPAPAGLASTGDAAMNLPWTHSGLPSVSIPAGRVAGMPVGLQLVGRFDADGALFAAAQSIEMLIG